MITKIDLEVFLNIFSVLVKDLAYFTLIPQHYNLALFISS